MMSISYNFNTIYLQVLRPVSSVCSLEVWQYYTSEELSHGAPYDLEILAPYDQDIKNPQRRVVTAGLVIIIK